MNNYTFFYYYTYGNERLASYDHLMFESLEAAKQSAIDNYDEVFFIAEGYIINLQETNND